MFHLMFVHYTLSSVLVAEWPPFGKQLPARLAICPHCLLSICNFYLFPILVLRAGFGFCLLQFLFIAFLILLSCDPNNQLIVFTASETEGEVVYLKLVKTPPPPR